MLLCVLLEMTLLPATIAAVTATITTVTAPVATITATTTITARVITTWWTRSALGLEAITAIDWTIFARDKRYGGWLATICTDCVVLFTTRSAR